MHDYNHVMGNHAMGNHVMGPDSFLFHDSWNIREYSGTKRQLEKEVVSIFVFVSRLFLLPILVEVGDNSLGG